MIEHLPWHSQSFLHISVHKMEISTTWTFRIIWLREHALSILKFRAENEEIRIYGNIMTWTNSNMVAFATEVLNFFNISSIKSMLCNEKIILPRETDLLFTNQNQIYNKYEKNDHATTRSQDLSTCSTVRFQFVSILCLRV